MQKSNHKDFCAILGLFHVYFWTSLCWKKVFIMQSPLLPQNCNKYRPFSLNAGSACLPITPFRVSLSVPMCALKSPKRIVDSVDPTLWKASLTSSTKAWYSLTALGHTPAISITTDPLLWTSTYRPVIPKESNRTHSLKWGLVRIPTLAWADILGSAPEEKSFYPPSKSTIPQPRLLVEETPTISRWFFFASYTNSNSFPVRVRTFQLPNSSLWWFFRKCAT